MITNTGISLLRSRTYSHDEKGVYGLLLVLFLTFLRIANEFLTLTNFLWVCFLLLQIATGFVSFSFIFGRNESEIKFTNTKLCSIRSLFSLRPKYLLVSCFS